MSTESQMPMGKAAAADSATPLPPLPMPPKGNVPMPLPMPPLSTQAAAGPVGAPAGMPPAPGAQPMPQTGVPQQPPYSVKMQSDGSSIYSIPSPDGNPANDIVLGVNSPPKLPKALQKPQP